MCTLMENFKRVYDSIKPPVWSPASAPNLSESSLALARWAAISGFAVAQPSTEYRVAYGINQYVRNSKLWLS